MKKYLSLLLLAPLLLGCNKGQVLDNKYSIVNNTNNIQILNDMFNNIVFIKSTTDKNNCIHYMTGMELPRKYIHQPLMVGWVML